MMADYNTWRMQQGMQPLTKDKSLVGVQLKPEHKAMLERLAKTYGFTHGKQGSLSKLFAAIADGTLKVVKADE